MKAPARSLATVLFTDIVGSTERAAELRDAGWRDLRQEHDRRVRRELRRFGGHEINTAGDSFLATFDGPARAIACAGAIRAAVHELGLEIRAGLHMGEIERGGHGHDVGGLAVHIGARVAAEAGPGEILASRSVHDALAGSAFDFEDRGVRTLKGVPGEWRLFAVTNVPAETDEALPGWLGRLPLPRRRTLLGVGVAAVLLLVAGVYLARRDAGPGLTPVEALAANANPGIAVLPFTVWGEGLDVWREGMVDVLSTNLDGAAGLRAIDSRTVLARWREGVEGKAPDDLTAALEIGRRTGARYALIGDAVQSGAGVRFGAEIYDLKDGTRVGQGQVEGSQDSLFSLVDRLSIEVLRAIYRESGHDLLHVPVLASVTTTSLPALKAYLAGEVLYRNGDFEGAFAAYEQAVAADSTFAMAIMRQGDAISWSPVLGLGATSEEYWERALKLEDRLPAREAMLARANRDLVRGTLESLDSLRLAVQRYPDDPDFWHLLGDTYYHMSDHVRVDEGEVDRAFSRAAALDPQFAHYYIHLVEIALHQADSARVANLIETSDRLVSEGETYSVVRRIALSLAFGNPRDRARGLAALDTMSIAPAFWVGAVYLGHPRFGRIQEAAMRRVLARPDAAPWMRQFLFYFLLQRGRFRAVLEEMDDGTDEPGLRARVAYLVTKLGMAGPTAQIERDLSGSLVAGGSQTETEALSADEETDRWRLDFYAGAYAADRGVWPAHHAAVERLRADAGRAKVSGHGLMVANYTSAAGALEAYGKWKSGQGAEALPVLEATFQEAAWQNEMIKWWLAELLVELRKPRDAAMYFSSMWGYNVPPLQPLAAFNLGKIYTDLGEFEKARESYEYALLSWADADPEMRPRIEAARQALARLPRPLRREGP